MRIGIVGHKGRLGSQLVHVGCEPISIQINKTMPKVDFPTRDAVIINCAAKTEVDRCETDGNYYKEAIQVNGWGIGYLANAYAGEIIHISTDYIFQGKRGAYHEHALAKDNDLPTKKMSYGLTKMVGEFDAGLHDNVYIVRTTGLYGGTSGKPDFLSMILDAYKNDVSEIKATTELRGNQTYVPHLAEALIVCAETKQKPNILHIASKDVISRYEFALMIADTFGLDKSKVKACKNRDVPGWVAERPKKGGLVVDVAVKLGLPIYTIQEGLEAYKNE